MRKLFTALIVIPLGLIFIVFAVANRHFVTVSFDPFNSADPSVAVRLPLFVVIILIAIMGVVAGGLAPASIQRYTVPMPAVSGVRARQSRSLATRSTASELRSSSPARESPGRVRTGCPATSPMMATMSRTLTSTPVPMFQIPGRPASAAARNAPTASPTYT